MNKTIKKQERVVDDRYINDVALAIAYDIAKLYKTPLARNTALSMGCLNAAESERAWEIARMLRKAFGKAATKKKRCQATLFAKATCCECGKPLLEASVEVDTDDVVKMQKIQEVLKGYL